ncbi:MAG: polysaccharide deacetylase family protein [Bryobacteraceae bacterium]
MDHSRLASVSLDLDNKWSYMKTRGDERWASFPSYLPVVVPRILDFLDRRRLKITFFVVGQDAVIEENKAALASIAKAGHEIGNHSFHHEPWLHLYSPTRIRGELSRAHLAIRAATGAKPVGFRGPGYSYSDETLKALVEMGYDYDASSLPTFLGPLARAYYFFTSGLPAAERKKRDLLFGGWRNGLLPLKPYQHGDGALLEIPVTTMPGLRTPIHPSYVLYVSEWSSALAMTYFRAGMRACRAAGVAPSVLLHPLDFLGADDGIDELSFFPAMKLPAAKKLAVLDRTFDILQRDHYCVTMQEHAYSVTGARRAVEAPVRATVEPKAA